MGQRQEHLPPSDASYVAILVTRDRRTADRYGLVMSAKGIPFEIYDLPDGFTLYVPVADAERAEREVTQYETGEKERRSRRAGPVYYPDNVPGLALALALLAVFHSRTYAPPGRGFWLDAGRASASRILDGEWWRAVTALTLHADLEHVLSNIVFGGIVLWALRRLIGPGRGWLLVLVSGAIGNWLNALFYASAHHSIGASTAVFGAVGLLAAVQLSARFRLPRTRIWIPFAAGLALLAMLGSSRKTDVMAHLFGFIAGFGVGLAALPALTRDLLGGRRAGWFFTATALLAVLTAWGWALIRM